MIKRGEIGRDKEDSTPGRKILRTFFFTDASIRPSVHTFPFPFEGADAADNVLDAILVDVQVDAIVPVNSRLPALPIVQSVLPVEDRLGRILPRTGFRIVAVSVFRMLVTLLRRGGGSKMLAEKKG